MVTVNLGILPILLNLSILRNSRILHILRGFAIFTAQKWEEAGSNRLGYDFVLCMPILPSLKVVCLTSVSCYQNNEVCYSTGNYNSEMVKL